MRSQLRNGGVMRGTDGRVGRCGVVEHQGYGALCFGCTMEMIREEIAERAILAAIETFTRELTSVAPLALYVQHGTWPLEDSHGQGGRTVDVASVDALEAVRCVLGVTMCAACEGCAFDGGDAA